MTKSAPTHMESGVFAGHGEVINLHEYVAPSELRTDQMKAYLGYLVRRLDARIAQSFHEALSEESITPARFTALSIIAANPGVRQTDLARELGIARPAALKLVNILDSLGLIECHPVPSDKRISAIVLSRLGHEKLAVIEQKVKAHEQRLTSKLTHAELQQLMGLLSRLLE